MGKRKKKKTITAKKPSVSNLVWSKKLSHSLQSIQIEKRPTRASERRIIYERLTSCATAAMRCSCQLSKKKVKLSDKKKIKIIKQTAKSTDDKTRK